MKPYGWLCEVSLGLLIHLVEENSLFLVGHPPRISDSLCEIVVVYIVA